MSFQYDKLKGRITEICKTNKEFADKMGMTQTTLSLKLNNKTQWTQPEIFKAVDVLMIDSSDIPAYFFTIGVQETKPT